MRAVIERMCTSRLYEAPRRLDDGHMAVFILTQLRLPARRLSRAVVAVLHGGIRITTLPVPSSPSHVEEHPALVGAHHLQPLGAFLDDCIHVDKVLVGLLPRDGTLRASGTDGAFTSL